MSKRANRLPAKPDASKEDEAQNMQESLVTFSLKDGQKNFIIGLDDCVCKVSNPNGLAEKLSKNDVLAAEEVPGAREWVNRLASEGHLVCFFTTRPERLRKPTEEWLKQHGFEFDSLIMGKPLALKYHYIDDRHVQATTFKGRYTALVKKEHKIQVFG